MRKGGRWREKTTDDAFSLPPPSTLFPFLFRRPAAMTRPEVCAMRRLGWVMVLASVAAGCASTDNDQRLRDYNDDGVHLFERGAYKDASESFQAASPSSPPTPISSTTSASVRTASDRPTPRKRPTANACANPRPTPTASTPWTVCWSGNNGGPRRISWSKTGCAATRSPRPPTPNTAGSTRKTRTIPRPCLPVSTPTNWTPTTFTPSTNSANFLRPSTATTGRWTCTSVPWHISRISGTWGFASAG